MCSELKQSLINYSLNKGAREHMRRDPGEGETDLGWLGWGLGVQRRGRNPEICNFLHLAKGKHLSSCPVPGLGAEGAAIWGSEDRMSLGITDSRRGVPNVLAAGVVGSAQLRPPAPVGSCSLKKWNSRASEDRLLRWKKVWTLESQSLGENPSYSTHQLCDWVLCSPVCKTQPKTALLCPLHTCLWLK